MHISQFRTLPAVTKIDLAAAVAKFKKTKQTEWLPVFPSDFGGPRCESCGSRPPVAIRTHKEIPDTLMVVRPANIRFIFPDKPLARFHG